MKRPYRWWRAIAPAAYDAALPLVGLIAYAVTLHKVIASVLDLSTTRPLAAIVFSLLWLVVGVGALFALWLRGMRFIGVIKLWRRQRRGT